MPGLEFAPSSVSVKISNEWARGGKPKSTPGLAEVC
jgi:hypothetical protein